MSPIFKSDNLGKYVRIRTGKLDANANDPDGDYPFFTCAVEPLRIATFSYDCECVLIAGNGDLNAKYYSGKFDAYQRTYIVESIDKNILDVRYLYYFLSTYMHKLREMSIGGVIKYIKLNYLTDVIVPLPPLPEQKRIAAILDKADSVRRKRQEALRKLDSLSQSIFNEFFGDPIQNPKHFHVSQMIELVDSQRPISYGILMPGQDQTEGVKYIRVVDMKNGGIELANVRKTTATISNEFRRSLLKPGDLLMSIRGHVGRCAIVPPELDGANITQDTVRLAIKDASPIFVQECLRTPGFQQWMATHTKGIAVRGINLGDVKLMPIILPPQATQEAFAIKASSIEKLKTAHRSSLKEIDTLFNSLLQRAFKGELYP